MLVIIAVKTAILVLGGGITVIAYRTHRRTDSPSFRALAIGFATVTFGALLSGVAHQVVGVGLETGVLINSVLTMLGFGIIIYSLYLEQ